MMKTRVFALVLALSLVLALPVSALNRDDFKGGRLSGLCADGGALLVTDTYTPQVTRKSILLPAIAAARPRTETSSSSKESRQRSSLRLQKALRNTLIFCMFHFCNLFFLFCNVPRRN